MGHRLSKIYTRTGDRGETGLGDGSRIGKASLRVEAMGEVDEVNSFVGLLLTRDVPERPRAALVAIQHDLFDLGGELSIPGARVIEAAGAGPRSGARRHQRRAPTAKGVHSPRRE